VEKGNGEKRDQANTRPAGTTTSFKTPPALFEASSMVVTHKSRLSHSMLLAASSWVKSVDAGSCGFVH
jgi:hypothetical protein